jgi:hypothetical protein
MANFCSNCGEKLPLLKTFSRDKLCGGCSAALLAKHQVLSVSIQQSIKANHTFTQEQFEILQTFDSATFADFYTGICAYFTNSDKINEGDYNILLSLKSIKPKDKVVRGAYQDAVVKMIHSVEQSILASHTCTAPQLQVLETFSQRANLRLYERLCEEFIANSELGEREIQTLNIIKSAVDLNDRETHQALAESIKNRIIATHKITTSQLTLLETFDRQISLLLYIDVRNDFIQQELSTLDLQTLRTIQQASKLNEEEIRFEEFVKPFYYVDAIRNEDVLPIIDLQIPGVGRPILRQGEFPHYSYGAVVYDVESVVGRNLAGVPASAFRIVKGVSYIIRPESARPSVLTIQASHISSGVLVITNQRLFLYPFGGQAPLSINLSEVLNFSAVQNGIQLWIEEYLDPYFFNIANTGAIEIFGLCLMFLLEAES